MNLAVVHLAWGWATGLAVSVLKVEMKPKDSRGVSLGMVAMAARWDLPIHHGDWGLGL